MQRRVTFYRSLQYDLSPRIRTLRSYLDVAIEAGNVDFVRRMMGANGPLEPWKLWTHSPIHKAIGEDQVEIVRLLLDLGVDIEIEDWDHYTPLMRAASGGSLEMVQLLVERGANINHFLDLSNYTHDERDLKIIREPTPFMLACAAHPLNPQIIRYLAEHGADMHAKNIMGSTALGTAAQQGNLNLMRLLLELGAKVTGTELIHPAWNGRHDALELLLATGVDINSRAEITRSHPNGDTALIMAAREGIPETVQWLLDRGADPEIVGADGETALSVASRGTPFEERQLAIIKILKQAGVALSIWEASAIGDMNRIYELLNQGIDVNAPCQNGVCPLIAAVSGRQIEVARLLLDRGARTDVHDWRALYISIGVNLPDLVDLLLEIGGESIKGTPLLQSALNSATYHGNPRIVDALLRAGAKPEPELKVAGPLFLQAINGRETGKAGLVRLLLDAVHDAPLKNKAIVADALKDAILQKEVEVVRLLLERGANPNATRFMHSSPLILAIHGQNREIVRLLLDHHANIHVKDRKGYTAIRLAQEIGDPTIIQWLKETVEKK